MFEDALLDSSPRRTSVLCRIHYLLSAFAGTLFFVQGLYLLPLLLAPAGERALFIAAAMVGVAAALYALMLCYVWADTRQQHLRTWPWFGVTLLLNLPGFLIYLVYSAQKTGDWKRAAIPLAYVAESMLVGVLILVPLIYTQALPRQLLITDIHISPPPGPPPAPPAGQRARPPPTIPQWTRLPRPSVFHRSSHRLWNPLSPRKREPGRRDHSYRAFPTDLGEGTGLSRGARLGILEHRHHLHRLAHAPPKQQIDPRQVAMSSLPRRCTSRDRFIRRSPSWRASRERWCCKRSLARTGRSRT